MLLYLWQSVVLKSGSFGKHVILYTQLLLHFLPHTVCKVFFDLIFVLDSSGSINNNHPDNYDQVLGYVHNFVSQLAIGPDANQVGVIIFGIQEEIVFNLSTYSNKSNLLQAINAVPYTFMEVPPTQVTPCAQWVTLDSQWRLELAWTIIQFPVLR